jgi:cytochrome P450
MSAHSQVLLVGSEFFGDQFTIDPHGVQARMRAEAPVHEVHAPNGLRAWVISRYEDARAALTDPRLSKDTDLLRKAFEAQYDMAGLEAGFYMLFAPNMLNSDPPAHSRLRGLLAKAFNARRVAALRPRIEQVTDELLDAMAGEEVVDLVDALAFALPITVICEMLGMPAQDQATFRSWTNVLVSAAGPETIAPAAASMAEYFWQLIQAKRAQPGDDLVSALIEATDAGQRLDEGELMATLFLMIVAGHETTVNLIANGVLAFLRHPEQLALVRERPELLPNAIEEILRFDGSVTVATHRAVTEDVEIGGVTIPAGEIALIGLSSANRDSCQFADADTFDITRPTAGHLGFGHGVHYCLGAPLARLEGEIAFRKLFERFPNMRLAVAYDELAFRPSVLFHGPAALPVFLES